MAEVEPPVETSPRSILAGSDMTSNVGAMNEANTDGTSDPSKMTEKSGPEIANNNDDDDINPAATPTGDDTTKQESSESPENKATTNTDDGDKKGAESPQPQASSQLQGGYPSHLTPQSAAGYYFGYAAQSIQEPPSPGGPGTNSVPYDVGSFFQQPGTGAFAPHNSPFQGPNTPLSPPRPTATMAAMVPPASPLFPRMNSSGSERAGAAPPSPSLPYMSPPLTGVYHQAAYPANSQSSNSPEEASAWTER